MGLSHKYKQTYMSIQIITIKKYIMTSYMLQLDNIYRQMFSNIHPLIVNVVLAT